MQQIGRINDKIMVASNRVGKNTSTVFEVVCKTATNIKDRGILISLWDKLIGNK